MRLSSLVPAAIIHSAGFISTNSQKPVVTDIDSFSSQILSRQTLVPNHTDPQTVLSFAQLTYNSYYEPENPNWIPIPNFNISDKFGWQNSGIRGYLFVDNPQSILIIVIKGTSLATPVGSGPTARLDKLNDNLMFSCCCAKAGWEWSPICDCPKPNSQCSNSCLLKNSNFDDSYYNLAQTIYLAAKQWFPSHTNIWMAGHSLGGALAALVALTNNLPSFSFESPGDLLFASRLGLIPDLIDPSEFLASLPIYHFGNDLDPIFLGLCTGIGSSCYWLDYAIETKCHIGYECVYTSSSIHTSSFHHMNEHQQPLSNHAQTTAMRSIRYHSIDVVIKTWLMGATSVPECRVVNKCLDMECPGWEFIE